MQYVQSYDRNKRGNTTGRYRKRRGRRVVTRLFFTAALAALLVAGWQCLPFVTGLMAQASSQLLPPHERGSTLPEQEAAPLSEAQKNLFTTLLSVADVKSTAYLELVNRDFPLETEPNSALLQSAHPTLEVMSEGILLQEATILATADLATRMRSENRGVLVVNSGYRSYSEQTLLYEQAPDKSYVQLPGSSEHHTGLAVDLVVAGSGPSGSAASAETWLAQNSWRYGLLLRYPANKQEITQIAYEPWHFRYVGTPHAWYCWQQGLCLEEYIEFLHSGGTYTAQLDGVTYYVLYQEAQDGVLYIPESLHYEVSNTGTGGYILTAWE